MNGMMQQSMSNDVDTPCGKLWVLVAENEKIVGAGITSKRRDLNSASEREMLA